MSENDQNVFENILGNFIEDGEDEASNYDPIGFLEDGFDEEPDTKDEDEMKEGPSEMKNAEDLDSPNDAMSEEKGDDGWHSAEKDKTGEGSADDEGKAEGKDPNSPKANAQSSTPLYNPMNEFEDRARERMLNQRAVFNPILDMRTNAEISFMQAEFEHDKKQLEGSSTIALKDWITKEFADLDLEEKDAAISITLINLLNQFKGKPIPFLMVPKTVFLPIQKSIERAGNYSPMEASAKAMQLALDLYHDFLMEEESITHD